MDAAALTGDQGDYMEPAKRTTSRCIKLQWNTWRWLSTYCFLGSDTWYFCPFLAFQGNTRVTTIVPSSLCQGHPLCKPCKFGCCTQTEADSTFVFPSQKDTTLAIEKKYPCINQKPNGVSSMHWLEKLNVFWAVISVSHADSWCTLDWYYFPWRGQYISP